jgi:4-amino-4-deoxy-L-arabinose transferase-like glycosyltransferase
MLSKSSLFPSSWRKFVLLINTPYCRLLIWIIPLIMFSSGDNSLMAHDEALYAWRARQMFDSGDWVAPWGNAHHKTPGFYWLIASFYHFFGLSDFSARLPSMIVAIVCILVIYETAKIILNRHLAFLSVAILSVEYLWLQYSRLSTPDVTTILLVFLAVFALLKSEFHPEHRHILGLIAGCSLALGFLIRSLMIFVPMIALLPYLVWEHRRHRHLANSMLYFGFVVGLIPSLVWLWFNWQRYADDSWGQLLGFAINLGIRETSGRTNILFYVWNLPLKAFPWAFFGLLGLVLVIRHPIPRYQMILVGFPVTVLTELSLFSTRYSHYSLCLYPFIAMLAAVGLDWLGEIYQKGGILQPFATQTEQKTSIENIVLLFPRNCSYAWGILGIVLAAVGLAVMVMAGMETRKYAILAVVSGLGCLIVPLVWISRYHWGLKWLTMRYWLASWLLSCWLGLATAGNLNLLGDFNPQFRAFFQQPAIASILKSHPVHFVKLEGKNSVLIHFYTPVLGQQVNSITELPPASYAWIYTPQPGDLSRPHLVIGTVQDYGLIQILP